MSEKSLEDMDLAVSPVEARAERARKNDPNRVADDSYVKAVLRSAEEGDKLIIRDRKTPLTVTGKRNSEMGDTLFVDLAGKGESEFYVNVPGDSRKPKLYYHQPGQGADAGSYTEKGTVHFAIPEEEYDEETRYGIYERISALDDGKVTTDLIEWYPDIESEHVVIHGHCDALGREGHFIIPKTKI